MKINAAFIERKMALQANNESIPGVYRSNKDLEDTYCGQHEPKFKVGDKVFWKGYDGNWPNSRVITCNSIITSVGRGPLGTHYFYSSTGGNIHCEDYLFLTAKEVENISDFNWRLPKSPEEIIDPFYFFPEKRGTCGK